MSLISLSYKIRAKFNRIGYKTDQNGILRRYIREHENWDAHLNKCKAFILENTAEFTHGKIAVLGSGWLLDVPIDKLLDRFDEIWLYDIHHPMQIRRKYGRNSKVKFINVDLTNGLIKKAIQSNSFEAFNDYLFDHEKFTFETKFDMVVSVNILNQLDIILCDFLKKRFNLVNEELNSVRQKIQLQHVELIMEHSGCLISDCIENYIDAQGQIIKQVDLIYANLSESNKVDSWLWSFDSHRQYRQKNNTSFTVNAYSF